MGYRLSAFGFLASETPSLTGNYGFKDQWLALEWISANIEAFGGQFLTHEYYLESFLDFIFIFLQAIPKISSSLDSQQVRLSSYLITVDK